MFHFEGRFNAHVPNLMILFLIVLNEKWGPLKWDDAKDSNMGRKTTKQVQLFHC
jgi:hypothetical protein